MQRPRFILWKITAKLVERREVQSQQLKAEVNYWKQRSRQYELIAVESKRRMIEYARENSYLKDIISGAVVEEAESILRDQGDA